MRCFSHLVLTGFFLLMLAVSTVSAMAKEKPYGKVTYRFIYNGQESDRSPVLFMEYSNGISKI